ncbi:MAG: hypothetical protein RLZZ501_1722 [Pseudomonadota bacterium]|jgi:hypothetical protein
MRPLFEAQVPKLETAPQENEDAACCWPQRGLYAISDGASESYHSAAWARVLVRRFIAHPELGPDWLAAAIAEYNTGFDREAMSWSAQAAFDRGSFATLLGLSVSRPEERVRLLAVGDSLAVLVSSGRLVASFPYESAEQFAARPMLLSTRPERNEALLRPATLQAMTAEWGLKGTVNPRVLLMTDALGAWLLADPDERLGRLLGLASAEAFADLVHEERVGKRMRRDDCTLLVLG